MFFRRNPVLVRPACAEDADGFAAFVAEGLSAASRRLRFHGAVVACSAAAAVAYVAPASEGRATWVAVEGGRIVGEARFVVDGADPGSAEFAIAVADRARGRGVADRLLDALLDDASARGLSWLTGEVLGGNAAMHAFMKRHGFVSRAADWMAAEPESSARYERAVPVSRSH